MQVELKQLLDKADTVGMYAIRFMLNYDTLYLRPRRTQCLERGTPLAGGKVSIAKENHTPNTNCHCH